VLALAAAVGTGAVMVWAGAPTGAALLGAIGSAAIVLIAEWVARTVPRPPDHRPPATGAQRTHPNASRSLDP